MAGRIRSIKPELLTDAKAARLSDSAWRCFVSCLLLADDFGRFAGDPLIVGGQVFPMKPAKAEAAIGELVDAGMLLSYQVRGQVYLEIANWMKHQRIDNAGKPRCPAPDESLRCDSPRVAASRGDLPPDPEEEEDKDTPQAAKRRKRPLPLDWRPKPEAQTEALEHGKDLAYEAKRFRNWAANADPKKDWDAAFSNWLSGKFINGSKPATKGRDSAMAALDAAIAARSTS